MIRLWRIEWFERTPPIEQVDFGNGHQVSAVDLLDGHFHQLAAQADNITPTSTPLVAAQSASERHAKMALVAPTLTPLTDLAEAMADAVPEAHPTPDFRSTLNKALTETHKQHRAQRTLGIRPTVSNEYNWYNFLLITVLMAVITLGVALHGRRIGRKAAA